MTEVICIKRYKECDGCFEIGDIGYIDCNKDDIVYNTWVYVYFDSTYNDDVVWLTKMELREHFVYLEEFIEIRNKKIDDILNN
jgi:hypothetical protein